MSALAAVEQMIDCLTPADASAAAALAQGFGWPHRLQDWQGFLALGSGVAWREAGALAGTAMLFPLDAGHASIGLVMVAPGLQGRGIGRRLMQAAIDLAGAASLLLHATPEGAGLYASMGFEARGVVQQWQATDPQPLPSGAARPAVPAARAAILRLDAEATGLHRARIIEALLPSHDIAVIGPAAEPTGYAIGRPFGRGWLVGPVVARDTADAIALVAALQRPGFLRVDIPAEAVGLAASLGAAGLASVDDVQPMVRGGWPSPGGPARRFGLASQALG